MYELIPVAATGLYGPTIGGTLHSATLTPAAAVATMTIRESGAGGPTLLTLQAAANGSSVEWIGSGVYAGQLHITLSGVGALAAIEI